MLRFLENHQNIPTLLVSYEDVVLDPRKEAAKIVRFLGLDLSDETARAVTQFVIPRDQLPREKMKRRSFLLGKLPNLIRKWSRKIS